MKYDAQIGQIQSQLPAAKSILIALSEQPSIDELASGLAMFLAFHQSGKEVAIVSQGTIKVSQSHLYGIDQVRNSLPQTSGGDLTLTLEGVVAADGTVPALEKLDWFPEGQNLNLVFHVMPGQTFEPRRIVPNYKGGSFNMVFVIGASSLTALGALYTANQSVFSGVPIINIDNDSASSQFGQVNIIDAVPTVSEMLVQIIPALGLQLDADTASNLLAGIYDATQNLTQNSGPDTFIAVGMAMQSGGKMPQSAAPVSNIEPSAQPAFPPLNQVFGFPAQPDQAQSVNNVVPQETASIAVNSVAEQVSPEERPNNEQMSGGSPEILNPDPNWLTPKIFKGGSVS